MNELELKKKSFNPAQLAGLEQRMSLLNSFMVGKKTKKNKFQPLQSTAVPRFASGQLTIIDLSDPFIDRMSACGLFEVITRLFVRAEVGTGKVLVVDEAHKVSTLSMHSFASTHTQPSICPRAPMRLVLPKPSSA